MLISDWPNAVAHVDADAFYASCERVRRPELAHRPVCVLSNHGAMVVAKTYDAKARGITTGMPVWEARKLLPEAEYRPAEFGYYGLMSDKLFAILRRYSPEVEVYSIDEGFMGLNGLRSLWRKGYGGIADDIRAAAYQEIGITVSVGVSVTKTLAKIASDVHKPDGTTVVPGRQIGEFLAGLEVQAIPSIGANRAALLHKFRIRTALEFAQAPEALMRRLLGKVGVDLRLELRGVPAFPLELVPKLPKSIARTASLGEVTEDRETLIAHLTHHLTRLAVELITKRYATTRLTVSLQRKSFEGQGVEVRLPYPTANYFTLAKAARRAFEALYRPGVPYRACGVILTHISSNVGETQDLFGVVEKDARQGQLFETVDAINRKHGAGTLRLASALPVRHIERARRLRYPLFEAN
jgi:DNA polymerase-4/DNA polymerase V